MMQGQSDTVVISFRAVWLRWLPLAISWSLMSLELPLVQSIVSGLPDSKINLAALGISFAICLMCESPILMFVSASAALVKDFASFRRLQNFALALSAIMSLLLAVVAFGLKESGLLLKISNADAVLAEKIFQACLISIVIPLAVGNRRFVQGVLIRYGKSFLLTLGTLARLSLIVAVGFYLSKFSSLNGAVIGATAGLAGMLGESILITLLSINTRRQLTLHPQETEALTYRAIIKFYSPLALSGVVNLSVLPVITFFMSQSIEPVSSVAAYQVLQGMLFFLSALALGLQEVVVSMLGAQHQGYRVLRDFTLLLAAFIALIFTIYVFTPLNHLVLIGLVGIPESLYLFLRPAMIMAIPVPVIAVFSVAMRGAVVVARKTGWITAASLSELLIVLIAMQSLYLWGAFSGLWNAVIALFIARLASCALLFKVFAQLRQRYQ